MSRLARVWSVWSTDEGPEDLAPTELALGDSVRVYSGVHSGRHSRVSQLQWVDQWWAHVTGRTDDEDLGIFALRLGTTRIELTTENGWAGTWFVQLEDEAVEEAVEEERELVGAGV